MYGNPTMTCFKYQVYLHGSEAITYLTSIDHRAYEMIDPVGTVLSSSPP
jgi:hypothetical protein